MHNTFKSQSEIQFEQNTKKTRSHTKVWKLKFVQIISKNPINIRLAPKFNKWTNQKPMSIKITKRHMLKDISHFKRKTTNDKEWDNKPPKRERFQQQTKLSTLFMMEH
jgi:hypothetical protein